MKLRSLITALLATAVLAAPASAQDGYIKVVSGYRISDGSPDPGNANACTAIVFYRWAKVPGTIKAVVTWRGTDGRPGSITSAPPFSDYFPALPSGGRHSQLEAGYFRSLGDSTVCGSKVTELQAMVPPTAKVSLTLNQCGGAGDVLKKVDRQLREERRDRARRANFYKTLGSVQKAIRKQETSLKARKETDSLDDLQEALDALRPRKPSRRAMKGAVAGLAEVAAQLKENKPGPSLEVLRQRSREAREMQQALDALSALTVGKKTAQKRLKSTLQRRRDAARKRARAC